MAKITKDKIIPLLNVSKTTTEEWKRIDKSTVFELTINEQTEDMDYICYPNAITETNSNKPELPQEIILEDDNPIYNFMIDHIYSLPVGSACKVPVMICFAEKVEGQENVFRAWRINENTISDKTMNTPDGKLSFKLNLGGTVEQGTCTITTDEQGVATYTFTPANKLAKSTRSAIQETKTEKDK